MLIYWNNTFTRFTRACDITGGNKVIHNNKTQTWALIKYDIIMIY